MGLFDKVKKILFDEDEVEVPVEEDELPERTPKKNENKRSVMENHNGDIENKVSEDTIVEIKLPVDEEVVEEPKKSFKFDVDIDDELPIRTRSNEALDELPTHEAIERDILEKRDRRIEEEMEKRRVADRSEEKRPVKEVKDYKKLLEDKPSDSTMKKPFKVTPIISPVFGIVDKGYKQEEPKEEVVYKEQPKKNVLPRDFGPVSYNDAPIPVKTKIIKEDIVELNTEIKDMEDIEEQPTVVKKTTVVETEIIMPEKKPEIPDIETSGIEEDYLNNGIEDAFESTSEYDNIRENDENISSSDIEGNIDSEEDYIPGYEDESIFDDTKELEPSYVSEYDEDFEATAPINLEELDSVTKSIRESKVDKDENASQIEEEIEEEVEDEIEEVEEPEEDYEIPTKENNKKKDTEVEDSDEDLDETIETDLFNLIDSMYKSDDEDEEEEE